MRKSGYGSWQGIRSRCLYVNSTHYHLYGAKGISVCRGIAESFNYFISVVGNRPTLKHSIDRIDNNGSYTCGVCRECKLNDWSLNIRWATHTQQMLNRNSWYKKTSYFKSIYKTRFEKYRVRIWLNGTYKQLGNFSTLKEAQDIRDNFLASINRV